MYIYVITLSGHTGGVFHCKRQAVLSDLDVTHHVHPSYYLKYAVDAINLALKHTSQDSAKKSFKDLVQEKVQNKVQNKDVANVVGSVMDIVMDRRVVKGVVDNTMHPIMGRILSRVMDSVQDCALGSVQGSLQGSAQDNGQDTSILVKEVTTVYRREVKEGDMMDIYVWWLNEPDTVYVQMEVQAKVALNMTVKLYSSKISSKL